MFTKSLSPGEEESRVEGRNNTSKVDDSGPGVSKRKQSVSLASSLEVDAVVQQHIDWLLRIKEQSLRRAYNTFNSQNQTLSSLLAMNLFLVVFSIPYLYALVSGMLYSKNDFEFVNSLVISIVLVVVNVCVWEAYVRQRRLLARRISSLDRGAASAGVFLQKFQMAVYLVIELTVCYRHCYRTIIGQCPRSASLTENWNCNYLAREHAIVSETSIIMMMIPLLYGVTVRASSFEFAVLLWACTLSALVFSIIYSEATASILFVFYYFLCSSVVLIETRRQNYYLFFTHIMLQKSLAEQEEANDKANAQEMRHMIANVAHDLKTVSSLSTVVILHALTLLDLADLAVSVVHIRC